MVGPCPVVDPSILRVDTVAPIRYVKRLGNRSDTCEHQNECDSHADTCVAGSNFVLLSRFEPQRYVTVRGYDGGSKRMMPIASVCSVYVDPSTSIRYLLIIHEALFASTLKGSLLNPNQMRNHGVIVHDTPVQFDPASDHCIRANTEEGDPICIPLSLEGVVSGFSSRKPTPEELAENLPRIVLTSDIPWDPNDPKFALKEQDAVQNRQVATVQVTSCDGEVAQANQTRFVKAVRLYN